jgi:hypothetical protein
MTPMAMSSPSVCPDYRHDAVWHASSTPQERLARVAARLAFVEMKQCFINAAADAVGHNATLLRRQVRQADNVIALWQLHSAVLASLPVGDARSEQHRQDLRRYLESAFPDTGSDTEFAAL